MEEMISSLLAATNDYVLVLLAFLGAVRASAIALARAKGVAVLGKIQKLLDNLSGRFLDTPD